MISKVTDPLKKVTDPVLLSSLAKAGIDKDYVEFYQDYAMPAVVNGKKEKGKSPYAKFYRDLKSNKRFMVVSGLPMVDADGNKNVAGWDDNGSDKNPRYTEKNNLFKASIDGTKVVLQVKNDQPDGRKQGDKLTYQAKLYLDNLEVLPANTDATRLPIDPTNENYTNNVLEWDYGICKRRLRLIEGRVLGSWVFAQKPAGTVLIKYNQIGDYRLKLGHFKVGDDEEVVTSEQFDESVELGGYPATVSDSATYYPDAHVESTSVDGEFNLSGLITGGWATLRNAAASDDIRDDGTTFYPLARTPDGTNYHLARAIILYDTSGLPDNAVISAATLSIYGAAKAGTTSRSYNIYSSNPASNTGLVTEDFDQIGATAFSTAITQNDWSTAGYNDYSLNASGIAAISLVSVSKYGMREVAKDVGDVAPTDNQYIAGWAAEQGAGYKPKLVVTYAIPITGTVTLTGSGVADAVIRCVDQTTGDVYTGTTIAGGGYEVDVNAGTYHIVVEYETGGVKYNAKSLWDVVVT